MTRETLILFAPFLGWFWGLPAYIRSRDDGDWLEPEATTRLLVMPFFGWFFFVFLTMKMGGL